MKTKKKPRRERIARGPRFEERMSFAVTPEMLEQLRNLAIREHLTLGDVARDAFTMYLDINDPKVEVPSGDLTSPRGVLKTLLKGAAK